MSRSSDTNRRMDFRQDVMLRIREETLTPQQFEVDLKEPGTALCQPVLDQSMMLDDSPVNEASDMVDSSVFKSIQELETKLNYLIGINVLRDSGQTLPEERPVNISATGICFVTEADVSADDRMKITVILPLFPPVFAEILAKVVRVKSMPKGKKRVGVTFVFRCEYEEVSIIKYVFKLQREKIRTKCLQLHQITRVSDNELL